MKAWTVASLIVIVTAACQPAGALFNTTVHQPDGSYPMPVVLGDQTGLVIGIEPTVGDFPRGDLPNVQPAQDDPNAVIVSWGTGACDDDSAVSFQRSEAGYRLTVVVHGGFSMGCTAQLLIRTLQIRFSEAIPASSILAIGGL
jgi:hypothetical protein